MIEEAVSTAGKKEGAFFSQLTVPMKLGYGVGELSFNIAYQTTALYLIFYFTGIFKSYSCIIDLNIVLVWFEIERRLQYGITLVNTYAIKDD